MNNLPTPLIKIIISYSNNLSVLRLVNKKFLILSENCWYKKYWYKYINMRDVNKLIAVRPYEDIITRCLIYAMKYKLIKVTVHLIKTYKQFVKVIAQFNRPLAARCGIPVIKLIDENYKKIIESNYYAPNTAYEHFKVITIIEVIKSADKQALEILKIMFPVTMKDLTAFNYCATGKCRDITPQMIKTAILCLQKIRNISVILNHNVHDIIITCKKIVTLHKSYVIDLCNYLFMRGYDIVEDLLFCWFSPETPVIKYNTIISCIKINPDLDENFMELIYSLLPKFIKTDEDKICFINNIICKYGNIILSPKLLPARNKDFYLKKIIRLSCNNNLKIKFHSEFKRAKELICEWIGQYYTEYFGNVYNKNISLLNIKLPRDSPRIELIIHQIFKYAETYNLLWDMQYFKKLTKELYLNANKTVNLNLMKFLHKHFNCEKIENKLIQNSKNKKIVKILKSNYHCNNNHTIAICRNLKAWNHYISHLKYHNHDLICNCNENDYYIGNSDEVDNIQSWFFKTKKIKCPYKFNFGYY